MKKILLACGTGVITCALIRKMLQQQLDARGLEGKYEFHQADAWEVAEVSKNYDLCVTTTVLPEACGCPLVMAAEFMMGKRTEETIDEICCILEA